MEFFNDFKYLAKEVFYKTKEKTIHQTQLAKEMLNLNKLEKVLKDEYTKLGKYFYDNQNDLVEKNYSHHTTRIASLKIDIKNLKEKINLIKSESAEKLNDIKNRTYTKSEEIRQSAKEKTSEIKEVASETVEIIKNTTVEKMEDIKKGASVLKNNLEHTSEEIVEGYSEIKQDMTDTLNEIKNDKE